MTGLRLIIENHPAWSQQTQAPATDASTPVPVQIIYMMIGRRNGQWHTIVPRIDRMADVLEMLDSASRSTLFDRLVITQTSLAGQAAGRWETILCAVPATALAPVPHRSFADILARAERRQAQQVHPTLPATASLAVPVTVTKTDASLYLVILFAIGLWSQAMPVLVGIAALCLLETAYQADWLDRLIPATQRRPFERGRFYFYTLCGGFIAVPLLAGFLLDVLNAAGR